VYELKNFLIETVEVKWTDVLETIYKVLCKCLMLLQSDWIYTLKRFLCLWYHWSVLLWWLYLWCFHWPLFGEQQYNSQTGSLLCVCSRHCKQLWHGDRSFIPGSQKSPTRLLVSKITTWMCSHLYTTDQFIIVVWTTNSNGSLGWVYMRAWTCVTVLILFYSMDIVCSNSIHPSIDASTVDHRNGI